MNILGKKYGRLTVVEQRDSKNWKTRWLCDCDCGNKSVVRLNDLKSGNTKSCGCFRKENTSYLMRTHGHTMNLYKTPTYQSWKGMKIRCYYPNLKSYKNYGGRGISVCVRWFRFENFLSDMGERPDAKTLDRIDVNGHYMPSNCRWATRKEQSANKRKCIYI